MAQFSPRDTPASTWPYVQLPLKAIAQEHSARSHTFNSSLPTIPSYSSVSSAMREPRVTVAPSVPSKASPVPFEQKLYRDIAAFLEPLPEAEQPENVKANLFPFQKQALSFMIQRERGWDYQHPNELWTQKRVNGRLVYVNQVNGKQQLDPPLPFFGGILADPMGMGKTLSILALIVAQQKSERVAEYSSSTEPNSCSDETAARLPIKCGVNQASKQNVTRSKATLIIVPPAVTTIWEGHISAHIEPKTLKCVKFYGRNRIKLQDDLRSCDLVITTYHAVYSEFNSNGLKSCLSTTVWRRIVLDEAHTLRNSNPRMARAICALQAMSKWAVTGAPIHHCMSDLGILLKFLDLDPYCSPEAFEQDVIEPWRSYNVDQGTQRLKYLLGRVMLRRERANLPQMVESTLLLNFNIKEHGLYESYRKAVVKSIDNVLNGYERSASKTPDLLQQINFLRRICNNGAHITDASCFAANKTLKPWTSKQAQETFEAMLGSPDVVCRNCGCEFDHDSDLPPETVLRVTPCRQLLCSRCLGLEQRVHDAFNCGCPYSPCPTAPVTTGKEAVPTKRYVVSGEPIPTKIQELVKLLQHVRHEKSVVFSCWSSTLEITSHALAQSSIPYVRIDRKTSREDRKDAIRQLEGDSSMNIILLALNCATLCNLNVASRVFLLEPQWNPVIERQAVAAVHRIGQSQKVHVTRLIMKSSFEQHLINLHHSEQRLTDIFPTFLATGSHDTTRIFSKQPLAHLRSILGQRLIRPTHDDSEWADREQADRAKEWVDTHSFGGGEGSIMKFHQAERMGQISCPVKLGAPHTDSGYATAGQPSDTQSRFHQAPSVDDLNNSAPENDDSDVEALASIYKPSSETNTGNRRGTPWLPTSLDEDEPVFVVKDFCDQYREYKWNATLPILTQIREKLLNHFQNLVFSQVPEEANEGDDYYRTSSTSSMNALSLGTAGNSGDKRKATNEGLDPGQGNSGGGNGEKRRKTSENDEKLSPQPPKRLACPYFKKDHHRYQEERACTGPGFKDIKALKDHLKRRHKLPLQCPRCRQPQANSAALDTHLRIPESCQLVQGVSREGLNADQTEKIYDSRSYDNANTDWDKWYRIWDIIFPGVPKPCTPYHDMVPGDNLNEGLTDSDLAVREEAYSIFRTRLDQRINDGMGRVYQDVREEMLNLFRDSLEDAYHRLRRLSSRGAFEPREDPLQMRTLLPEDLYSNVVPDYFLVPPPILTGVSAGQNEPAPSHIYETDSGYGTALSLYMMPCEERQSNAQPTGHASHAPSSMGPVHDHNFTVLNPPEQLMEEATYAVNHYLAEPNEYNDNNGDHHLQSED